MRGRQGLGPVFTRLGCSLPLGEWYKSVPKFNKSHETVLAYTCKRFCFPLPCRCRFRYRPLPSVRLTEIVPSPLSDMLFADHKEVSPSCYLVGKRTEVLIMALMFPSTRFSLVALVRILLTLSRSHQSFCTGHVEPIGVPIHLRIRHTRCYMHRTIRSLVQCPNRWKQDARAAQQSAAAQQQQQQQ